MEDLASRTETQQVFVNPDGTSTMEIAAYPQRARKRDGMWSALDPTLQVNPDGSLSPVATTVGLTLSGGGDSALLSSARLGLSWPGVLPKPTIAGAKATYPEVLPGVDLVVTALETGFSEVLVVKNRTAVKNPALRKVVFGTSLAAGLRWDNRDGSLRAVDAAGKVLLAAPAPLMWDSSQRPSGKSAPGAPSSSGLQGPGATARKAAMGLRLESGKLALMPDVSLLDDPSAQFPLYLDPTLTWSGWTMINNGAPDEEYWNFDKHSCPNGYPSSTQCAKVGKAVGYNMVYRSMFQFDTSGLAGKIVLPGVALSIDLLHSSQCGAYNWTHLMRVNTTIGPATNWNNNAAHWDSSLSSYHQGDACTSQREGSEFGGWGLQSTMEQIARDGTSWVTWGLRAEEESNSNDWKKYDAGTAKLIVPVNTPPSMPSNLTVDGKACASGANRPAVKTLTPTLRANAHDADGDSVQTYFAYAKWDGTAFVDIGGGNQVTASGAAAMINTSTLTNTGRYTFRADANDSPTRGSHYGVSPVTHMPGNCEWDVDMDPPTTLDIGGNVYKDSGCPEPGCGSVGQAGEFTFSSDSDVTAYRWGFASPPTTVANASAPGAPVTVPWTPTSGGAKTLYVVALDRAGHEKPGFMQFYVAPPSPEVAKWKLDEAAGATSLADDSGNGKTATTAGNPSLGTTGRVVGGGTAMRLDGVDDTAAATSVLADTTRSFSVATWVKADVNDNGYRSMMAGTGTEFSPFLLRRDSSNKWVFTTVADAATDAHTNLTGTAVSKPGVWTHVAGTYDSASRQMRLYVNGKHESSATVPGVIAGTGGIILGRDRWDGNPAFHQPWRGSLADARVWDRVISDDEVTGLAAPTLVGKWNFAHGENPSADESDYFHDLNFAGDAHVPSSASGNGGTYLKTDGSGDYVATDATAPQVVHTDQSFTISAWVRLENTTNYERSAVAQNGANVSNFFLGTRDNSKWTLQMRAADTAACCPSAVAQAGTVQVNTWTHLVAIYDAQAAKIHLHVNPGTAGALSSTVGLTSNWPATGQFVVGGGRWASTFGDWLGSIDTVRAYQGVKDPATIA